MITGICDLEDRMEDGVEKLRNTVRLGLRTKSLLGGRTVMWLGNQLSECAIEEEKGNHASLSL